VIGFALALLTFPEVRSVGAGLLASAGVVGIVAGIAAKPIFGNLLAGLQIALTQPIRLDDVVIVEGEWGRIEEIGRTFVVVAIWDQRRLVVPLQYFIEKPFQNWTRTSANLLGTAFLWVDYGMPLAPLRAELERICRSAREWDGRVCLIQVTDASERAMQLRVLVSAAPPMPAKPGTCAASCARRSSPTCSANGRSSCRACAPRSRAASPTSFSGNRGHRAASQRERGLRRGAAHDEPSGKAWRHRPQAPAMTARTRLALRAA
jgi:hypothetical protein